MYMTDSLQRCKGQLLNDTKSSIPRVVYTIDPVDLISPHIIVLVPFPQTEHNGNRNHDQNPNRHLQDLVQLPLVDIRLLLPHHLLFAHLHLSLFLQLPSVVRLYKLIEVEDLLALRPQHGGTGRGLRFGGAARLLGRRSGGAHQVRVAQDAPVVLLLQPLVPQYVVGLADVGEEARRLLAARVLVRVEPEGLLVVGGLDLGVCSVGRHLQHLVVACLGFVQRCAVVTAVVPDEKDFMSPKVPQKKTISARHFVDP